MITEKSMRRSEQAPPASRARIEALLRQFPSISSEETKEISYFLRKGPPLERGMLRGNAELAPQLRVFLEQHGNPDRLRLKDYLLVLVILAAAIAAGALLWDSGIPS